MTLLFGVVIVVSALVLYRSGQLTSDKMALQNAADGMAYSVSVLEARDLNFASYMNRAVIANEVAIGQAVGLASWAFHFESIGRWLLEYDKFLIGPTSGGSTGPLTAASKAFQIPGRVFVTLLTTYAKGMTVINTNINFAYGQASKYYHIATIAGVIGVLDEIRDDSAPDGAEISDFGLMALLSHLYTFNANFTQTFNPKTYSDFDDAFKDGSGDRDADGYGRLSAAIHNSADPFTKGWHNPDYNPSDDISGRGWTFRLFEVMADQGWLPFLPFSTPFIFPAGPIPIPGTLSGDVDANGDMRFNFNSRASIDFGVGSIGAEVDFSFWFGLGLERQGSSELRLLAPLTGSNSGQAAGEAFSWSSADATRAFMNLGVELFVRAWANAFGFGVDGSARAIAAVDGESEELTLAGYISLSIDAGILGSFDVGTIAIEICNTCPFPASLPLGTGFAQAAPTATQLKSFPADRRLGQEKLGTGDVAPEAYGGAADTILPWNYPSTPTTGGLVGGIQFQPTIADPRPKNVSTAYKGLPAYVDTAGGVDTSDPNMLFGSGGPFFLMALRIPEDTFSNSLYDDHPGSEPSGQDGSRNDFRLDEQFAGGDMTAVAKSEVYFKRPLDLAQFARGDGYREHGSAFNPYWQAHLVETSHADRVLSIAIDHGQSAQGGYTSDAVAALAAAWSFIEGVLPTDSGLLPR